MFQSPPVHLPLAGAIRPLPGVAPSSHCSESVPAPSNNSPSRHHTQTRPQAGLPPPPLPPQHPSPAVGEWSFYTYGGGGPSSLPTTATPLQSSGTSPSLGAAGQAPHGTGGAADEGLVRLCLPSPSLPAVPSPASSSHGAIALSGTAHPLLDAPPPTESIPAPSQTALLHYRQHQQISSATAASPLQLLQHPPTDNIHDSGDNEPSIDVLQRSWAQHYGSFTPAELLAELVRLRSLVHMAEHPRHSPPHYPQHMSHHNSPHRHSPGPVIPTGGSTAAILGQSALPTPPMTPVSPARDGNSSPVHWRDIDVRRSAEQLPQRPATGDSVGGRSIASHASVLPVPLVVHDSSIQARASSRGSPHAGLDAWSPTASVFTSPRALSLGPSTASKPQCFVRGYVILRPIGRGAHGTVYLAAKESAAGTDPFAGPTELYVIKQVRVPTAATATGLIGGGGRALRRASVVTARRPTLSFGVARVESREVLDTTTDDDTTTEATPEGATRSFSIGRCPSLNKSSTAAARRPSGLRVSAAHEIAVMKRLRHRNVVRLEEVIEDGGAFLLVMPYIANGPVLRLGRDGTCEPLDIDIVRGYMRQLLAAVAYLHRNGVVHCDIKPENVLLGDNGHVFLSDFGVSRIFERAADASVGTGSAVDDGSGSASVSGFVTPCASFTMRSTKCTPAFAAPETLTGEAFSGAAADVWSVGVTMYAMLFGRLPYFAPNLMALFRIIGAAAVEFTEPQLSRADLLSVRAVAEEAATGALSACGLAPPELDEALVGTLAMIAACRYIAADAGADLDDPLAKTADFQLPALSSGDDDEGDKGEDRDDGARLTDAELTALQFTPRHGHVRKYVEALRLLRAMLQRTPSERVACAAALRHAFFGSVISGRIGAAKRSLLSAPQA